MGLFLHLGSSGAGKSRELFEQIFEEASADIRRNFFVIVPEQFTLQTQRDMIAMSKQHGIMNIDVLSFPRMAHRIFGELGIREPVVLEDTGKCMIVKAVALNCSDRLGIYASKVGRQGFIEEMKSVISEFYQYGIDPEKLDEMETLAASRPQLVRKLKDIRLIYEGFRDYIAGDMIMSEEVLKYFTAAIPRAESLKNAVLCFDGFTGFTVGQMEVIDELMKVAGDIHVTLTVDPRDAEKALKEDDLFYLSSKTALALEKLADRHGIPSKRIIVGRGEVPHRFAQAPALAALEHGIFRHPMTPAEPDESIRLVSCENPAAEIRFVISEIEHLVNEEGLRYRDIAVIAGDTSIYSNTVNREFARAHIPFFLDSKRNIVGTAPVELLRAAIEAAESGFSYASVFRFIKTGLTPITIEQSSKLENYCLALNIHGPRAWSSEWTRTYRTRYTLDMAELNELREKLYNVLSGPAAVLSSRTSTVGERLDALRGLLEVCEVEQKLAENADRLAMSDREEERLRSREEGQLYPSIMAVFERIGMLLGKDAVSPREFREILETGFKEAKLALTPPGLDGIMIGDMERSRLTSIKVLFFLGVNDGIIPGAGRDKGLLSDAERELFEENDIELSPTKRRSSYLNEFYLYLNLTKPSKRLYVSFFRTDAAMNEARPSYLIGLLKKLFTGIAVREIKQTDEELLKGTDRGASAAASIIRDKNADELTDAERTVLAILRSEDRDTYVRIMDAAFFKPPAESLRPDTAARLYNNVLTGSVTLLESYASCSFAMLMNYGLKLEERRKYEIGSLELGVIYHKAVELYGVKLNELGVTWHETDEELRSRITGECLKEALAEFEGVLGSSKRMEYAGTRIERVLRKTIETLDAQVRAGDYEPVSFEQSFNVATSFMKLRGTIDRMDICERGGHKYLRVIDYKSGAKDFDLCKLYYGLQIQLGVYLAEGRELLSKEYGADYTPGGIYYCKIDDPVIDMKEERDPDKIATAKAKRDRLIGPTNCASDAIVACDNSFRSNDDSLLAPNVKSGIISVSTKSGGDLYAYSKTMTSDMFDRMTEFLKLKMCAEGEEIMNGNAQIAPSRYGKETNCEYCSYHNICGFDTKLGYRYRENRKLSEDDVWERINGVLNSNR